MMTAHETIALRYAKENFRNTICADCLTPLSPALMYGRVRLQHACGVAMDSCSVDLGGSEAQAWAAMRRLDYLDEGTFPRAGFSDIYSTVREGALTYKTTVRLNKDNHPSKSWRIDKHVPCRIIVRIVLPIKFAPSDNQALNTAFHGLMDAYVAALTCSTRSGIYTYLPRFEQKITLYFGNSRMTLCVPIEGVSNGLLYTWPTSSLSYFSQPNFQTLFSETLALRHLSAVRGIVETEASYLDFFGT